MSQNLACSGLTLKSYFIVLAGFVPKTGSFSQPQALGKNNAQSTHYSLDPNGLIPTAIASHWAFCCFIMNLLPRSSLSTLSLSQSNWTYCWISSRLTSKECKDSQTLSSLSSASTFCLLFHPSLQLWRQTIAKLSNSLFLMSCQPNILHS